MADAKAHDQLIETIIDYKKGNRNLKTGSAEVARLMGLTPEIAAIFLTEMKRDNIRDLRGYDASPPHLIKARSMVKNRRGRQPKKKDGGA